MALGCPAASALHEQRLHLSPPLAAMQQLPSMPQQRRWQNLSIYWRQSPAG
jgi:hypothetical protein